MAKASLRTAALSCLAVWVAVWLVFMAMRFSTFDIRVIPGIGPIMLLALVIALVAPLVATGIAGAVLVGRPRVPSNWLIFGCAIIALIADVLFILLSSWL